MGNLAVLPQETLEQIFEAALPSGESYEFDGRLKASSASAIPPLSLLLVNRESYWLAHRIWLKKSHFNLIAKTTHPGDLIRVSNNYEVPKGSTEASIEWIANMAAITLIINATLDVRGIIGGRFQNFFDIVKLLRKHDLFITLNGILPINNTSKGPNAKSSKAIAINIHFANEWMIPRDVSAFADTHLSMIDLGHVARKFGWPLEFVKSQFNEILARPDPIVESKSSVAGHMAMYELVEAKLYGRRWAIGPRDLLYDLMPDALRSTFAVNKGEQPITSVTSRKWARYVCAYTKAWCLYLKNQLIHFEVSLDLFRIDSSSLTHAAPPCVLPHASLFGHYGMGSRIPNPITKRQLERHIRLCETELYRGEAHIVAMLPYTF